MKRIFFVFVVIAFVFSSHAGNLKNADQIKNGDRNSFSNPISEKKETPNIVFVFADDMGWGDAHANNPASQVKTPNIDKLAQQGMRFTDAHCVGSLCAPSRFGLMTGRNPVIWRNYGDAESDAWNCMTMPQMLQKQGYYTACVGKWHFGVLFEGKDGRWGQPNPTSKRFPKPADNWILTAETRLGPTDRGFDYFFGTPLQPGGGWYANMEGNKLLGNPKLSPNLPATEDFDIQKWMGVILSKSKEQIRKLSKGDQPFFLYFPLNSPHKPIVPDDPFIGKSGIGKYGDYVQQVDWCLGEIMKSIDDAGIRENTILIFSSDNGSYYYLNSVNSSREDNDELLKSHYRANGPFKVGKGQPEEGGHRIPYIVRWPKHIEAGAVNETTISLGDHFATFAALTGYQLDQEDAIDSWNILPFWTGDKPDENYQNRIFYHFNNNPEVDAVRKGKWKMIPECYRKLKKRDREKGENSPDKVLIPGQLYDLSKDPGETNNLWKKYPEVVKELSQELTEYKKRKSSAPHAK
ncbi:sulfatase family protein [Sunxiuqinia sp. A32]|uniref:sulfatase family protein n=1 Tax=Sunxiuqinia sp. A32 TaxID=3461496 RepID=UPI0040458DA0